MSVLMCFSSQNRMILFVWPYDQVYAEKILILYRFLNLQAVGIRKYRLHKISKKHFSKINGFTSNLVYGGVLGSLFMNPASDLSVSRWRIQYGGKIQYVRRVFADFQTKASAILNLQPPYWIRHFEITKYNDIFMINDPKNPRISKLVQIR